MLLAFAAIGAVVCTDLVDFDAYHLRYRILNASSAASWSHAVVAGALAVGATACLAGARRPGHRRAAWITTACLLALLFADEVSGLHSHIDALNHGKLLYAPLLVILGLCVWQLTNDGSRRSGARIGAGLLLMSSYAIHVIEPHNIVHALGWGVGGWQYQVVVTLKEGTELAGVLLALLALCSSALPPKARHAL